MEPTMNPISPTVGQWYLNRDDGSKFAVIDIDDDGGYIELQDQDGLLAEIGTNVWSVIHVELTTQDQHL